MDQDRFLLQRNSFNIEKEGIQRNRANLYQRRAEFVEHFSPEFIQNMRYEDFAIGLDRKNLKFNFSYAIEREFEDLGYIYGSTSLKFGFYYGRTKKDETIKFRYPKKFGTDENYIAAFSRIKETLLHLIENGASSNYNEILKNKFSPMFQGKILSIYYPEQYLNVFAPDHLDYFLDHFKINRRNLKAKDVIYKRQKLQEFKNADPVMAMWTNDMFSYFLYTRYPGGPPNDQKKKTKKQTTDLGTNGINIDLEEDPVFAENQVASFINLSILPPQPAKKFTNDSPLFKKSNRNYADETRRLKKLGDKGEELVWDLERARLIENGMNDLLDHMQWPGKKGEDYKGYDILSYEKVKNQPTEIRIEVKATKHPPTGNLDFYITDNEYQKAIDCSNYYLYIVFEVTSQMPKVLRIKDPFGQGKDNIHLTPVQYKASIKIKQSKL